MKQYLDVIIKDAEFRKEIVPEVIHISLKNESLHSRSFIGYLVTKLGPYGIASLMNTCTIIYIDDIFDANPDSLLNPGIIAMYIKEVIEDSSDNWKVILTKSIEVNNKK